MLLNTDNLENKTERSQEWLVNRGSGLGSLQIVGSSVLVGKLLLDDDIRVCKIFEKLFCLFYT